MVCDMWYKWYVICGQARACHVPHSTTFHIPLVTYHTSHIIYTYVHITYIGLHMCTYHLHMCTYQSTYDMSCVQSTYDMYTSTYSTLTRGKSLAL